jgi:hypothetical protein
MREPIDQSSLQFFPCQSFKWFDLNWVGPHNLEEDHSVCTNSKQFTVMDSSTVTVICDSTVPLVNDEANGGQTE